jgi:serine/threonine protein kinase
MLDGQCSGRPVRTSAPRAGRARIIRLVNLIGQRVGSYIVERELGSGGTGTVYACRHTMIDREVAVKVLHDEQARDPDQVARFFQEAKAAAEIGHPNIIVIIDYGTLELSEGSRTYVMMESLQGQSLDKRLQRGGLSLEEIRHILAQTASALVACHGKGIIHRDLKPSNIFLCERSFDPMFVKVLDFGTAKLAAPTPGLRRTQLGVVIGTPSYMSPEQCEGKGAIDHRSDLYSLGVMLYEMLTGALPHEGDIGQVLLGHMYRTPAPPRERNPSIPPEWEALCLRMMEKAREARFQSVTELAHALEDLRGHASAYEEVRARRVASGHSGHTLVAPAADVGQGGAGGAGDAGDAPAGLTNQDRPTLHVTLGVGPHGTGPHAQQQPHTPPAFTQQQPPAFTQQQPPAFTQQQPPAFTQQQPPTFTQQQPPALPPFTQQQPPPTPPPFSQPPPIPPTTLTQQPPPPPPTYTAGLAQPSVTAQSFFDPRGPCASLVSEPRHSAFSRTLMVRPPGRWFELTEVCHTAHVAPPASIAHELGLFVTWVEHPYPDPSLAAVIFLSLRTGWSTVVLCPRVR